MSNIELYREKQELIKNYNYAIFVINYDLETICPKNDKRRSSDVINYFYKEIINITNSDEYYNLLKDLIKNSSSASDVELLAIKKEFENLTKMRKIPKDVLFDGIEITSLAGLSWERARDTLDYTEFENDLNKLVKHNKKVISYSQDKYKGYDVLLDDMEDNFTMEKYDEFFNLLEKEILPLMKKILNMPKLYNEKLKAVKFDIDKQKKLTKEICDLMGYTNDVGYIGETIHPFTNGNNVNDVRTTTRYDENLLFSNLYSVMHEVGHALYELQNNKEFSETVLMGGASCALHESQSRFYENMLGRSREFITFIYPILNKYFKEELKDYTLDDIFYYCNDVTSQFIRTEADELTYPFHVLIRYKIEKLLFTNKINPNEIDKIFNELMHEYFGITPKNKLEGCFQDVHWSSGFGYFPTYALGSAISAQIYHYMEKDIDIKNDMLEGNFKNINNWLKEHVHKYGASKKNLEVIKLSTGEDFNPKYYIDYLKNKFKKIYNIK